MTSVKVPDNDLGTFNDAGPSIYPVCGDCRAAWAFTWCLGLNGSRWLWVSTCKHKRAKPILVGRGGSDAETSES
jgi:hypothetical protein